MADPNKDRAKVRFPPPLVFLGIQPLREPLLGEHFMDQHVAAPTFHERLSVDFDRRAHWPFANQGRIFHACLEISAVSLKDMLGHRFDSCWTVDLQRTLEPLPPAASVSEN